MRMQPVLSEYALNIPVFTDMPPLAGFVAIVALMAGIIFLWPLLHPVAWSRAVIAAARSAGSSASAVISSASRPSVPGKRRPAAAPAALPVADNSAGIDVGRQWTRVASVVAGTVDRARQLGEMQEAAARQLDSTDYALHCLVRDLGDILPGMARAPFADTVAPPAAQQLEAAAPAAAAA